MTHRVLVVIGTRPEAIKMAPVIAALEAHREELETRIALTGQHDDLVDQVMHVFGLEAHDDLAIMTPDQTVYDVLSRTLEGLRRVLGAYRPDFLLVQGDTATVFAASLAGYLERVPIGHVEAGLRSHDKWAPFPEEIFRRLTDVVADHYFAPTPRARDALLAEGTPAGRIHVTGNTVVDALLTVADQRHPIRNASLRSVVEDPDVRLVLLTAHRRESFGAPLREAFAAVLQLVERVPDIRLVYPVHPNPNVVEPAREILGDHPRILLTAPLDYLDLVAALRSASLVLTDSGGIQEEAPTFGVPLLVLREVTERPEGVAAGIATLVGTSAAAILERGLAVLGNRDERRSRPSNPYGDGRAGARIADILVSELSGCPRRTVDWTP